MRESFNIDKEVGVDRDGAQVKCARSIVEQIIVPYERAGHRVSVFLTMYAAAWGNRSALIDAFAPRVASVNTLQHASTASQILPLAAALTDLIGWTERFRTSFDAVVVTRFDAYFKSSLLELMGGAASVSGLWLLWRETGGHWRQHANPWVVNATFKTASVHYPSFPRGFDWRRKNIRVPDVLLGFPAGLSRCFRQAALNEMFPTHGCPNCPLNFLHNLMYQLKKVAPDEHSRVGFLLPAAAFDSNPCRAACMLNPLYDLLPRMKWITESNICQRPSEFQFDATSQSLCCPSPTYCCPNSVKNCDAPDAVRFDAVSAGVSDYAIEQLWPTVVPAPYNWEMTERSFLHVANVWRTAGRRVLAKLSPLWKTKNSGAVHGQAARYEAQALRLLRAAMARGRVSEAALDAFVSNSSAAADRNGDMFSGGHCGQTTEGDRGDCAAGDRGSLNLPAKPGMTWSTAMLHCTRSCQSCARCHFISVSLALKDCSWYARCDLRNTSRFRDFRSHLVRRRGDRHTL